MRQMLSVCVCGWYNKTSVSLSLISSPFSIDICQFSMTSLLSSTENKDRSISFRAIILLMIYAGTIILNLLAASIDDRFATKKFPLQSNATTIVEPLDVGENNSVIF